MRSIGRSTTVCAFRSIRSHVPIRVTVWHRLDTKHNCHSTHTFHARIMLGFDPRNRIAASINCTLLDNAARKRAIALEIIGRTRRPAHSQQTHTQRSTHSTATDLSRMSPRLAVFVPTDCLFVARRDVVARTNAAAVAVGRYRQQVRESVSSSVCVRPTDETKRAQTSKRKTLQPA